MTAYARKSAPSSLGRFVMEIQSVNRKGLDISMHLPRGLSRFETQLRKEISSTLERGQVLLRLSLEADEALPSSCALGSLKRLKQHWEQISEGLGYRDKTIDLPFLVSQWDSSSSLLTDEEEKEVSQTLKELALQTLTELVAMKKEEGRALATDLLARLERIEENLAHVEARRDIPLMHYREKMLGKLAEMQMLDADMQQRLAKEVILLAEKSDVTEEIVRLKVHLGKYRQVIRSSEKSVGRTLDFLAQEMHREMSTLGAKSVDSEIASHCIAMKSELEKIREQVQNIE
jgi:uncharacterized protein (TIGR00255 family)